MKKKLSVTIGVGILCAAALCGCGSDEPASDRERIREKETDVSDEEEIDEVNAPPADHVPEPAEDTDENVLIVQFRHQIDRDYKTAELDPP